MATRVTVFRSRYRAARFARRLSGVVATLAGGPSRIIAPLIVSALGLWLTTKTTGGRTQATSSILLEIVGYLLAGYAAFMVVRWGDRLRRTTTFEEFRDETGEGLSAFAKSLSVRVPIEYEQLRRLHRQAEETDSYEKPIDDERYRSPRATVKAEDVATFLETAFQPESTVSVGFFRIPIQALGTVVGRLLRGPRITGTLLRDSDGIRVVAQFVGGRRSESWHVIATSGDVPSEDVVHELACRIFTALADNGPGTWQAASCFCAGMSEYRKYVSAEGGLRKVHLQRAERMFHRALAEDRNLDFAHYNLGVVYAKLREFRAAERAFLRAIARNPSEPAAYYALARIRYFDLGKKHSARDLAERVASRSKEAGERARAHDLLGLIKRGDGERGKAIQSREQAVRDASWSLVRAELRANEREGVTPTVHRELAATCMMNLAIAYSFEAEAGRAAYTRPGGTRRERRQVTHVVDAAECLLKQALELSRVDGEIHFELAKLYEAAARYADALEQYEFAMRATPDSPYFAAYLAKARADAWERDRSVPEELVRAACMATLDSPEAIFRPHESTHDAIERHIRKLRGRPQLAPLSFSDRSEDVQELLVSATVDRVAQAFETLGDRGAARSVREMPRIFAELESSWDEVSLDRLASRYEAQGRAWAHGRALFQRGVLRLERGEPASAQTFLKGALTRLREHRGEVRELEVRAWRARAFRECGRLGEALREAERAVALDPLSRYERYELGRVYEAIGDWPKARDAFAGALLLSPDDPLLHWHAGRATWRLACGSRGDPKLDALTTAQSHFEQLIELDDRPKRPLIARYWLGRIATSLGDHEAALDHYRGAQRLPDARPQATLFLGEEYLKLGAHNEATSTFEECLGVSDPDGGGELGGELGAELRAELRAEWPTELLHAWAHVGIAQSYARRWLSTRVALRHLRDAERCVEDLTPTEPTRELEAAASACRGEIYLHKGDADRAIRALERAASLHEDGRTHGTLALAYESKMRTCQSAPEIVRALRSAQGHAALADRAEPAVLGKDEQNIDLERRLRVWERYARRGPAPVQEPANGASSGS